MKKKGFTMLEILIVIIIIAILATFAIPQYLKASKRAIASEAVTTIGALRGAIARYHQEHNQMPSTGQDLSNLDIDSPNTDTNANFIYEILSNTAIGNYTISAIGKDGTRGEGLGVCYNANGNNMEILYSAADSSSCSSSAE